MLLQLNTINIFNFKSFKGLHSVIGLDKHFTAIVGPNGSGKSNILDSILFVLGFKAKKMRHAVLKDLINSSCSECYVELIFNDFVLKRSLKGKIDSTGTLKNVVSKFELDGIEIQSNEAIEYLKNKGIDLENNRFLILQGEIESISLMNPLELLDYVEDCIGSSSLKPEIDKVEIECKTKKDELDTLMSNLKFIETDYLFKKGRRDNKLELLVFKNMSLVYKNKIVLVKESIAERKIKKLFNEKLETEKFLDEISRKNKETIEHIKELEKQSKSFDLNTKEAVLEKFRANFRKIERENEFKALKKQRLEKSIEKVIREITDNKNELESWTAEYNTIKSNIESNLKEIKSYEKQVEIKNRELSSYSEITMQRKKLESFEKNLLILMNKRDQYIKDQEEIKAKESKLQTIATNLSKVGQIKNLSNEKAKLESEVFNIKKDINLTSQEINNRKRRAEEFNYLETIYKREREVYENIKSVKGVYGFLKDLGSFDTKYEQAIDAATKSLNSIVVDTTGTAEQCIEIINKKNLNRTTFIIMDKLLNPGNENQINSNSQLLYKQVKCEGRFVKCFYFALKDTIVASNLEEARAIAFGKVRQRVVTLDGKLLEKSGVMSGGKASKKLKSATELEEILKNMESIYQNKKNELLSIEDLENQSKLSVQYQQQAEKLQRELNLKRKKFNSEELELINQEIEKIKQNIKALENIKIPTKALDLKGEIQILNEKIHILDQVNQDLKIKLDSSPTDNTKLLEKSLQKFNQELSSIEFEILPDSSVLNQLEYEYNCILSEYKKLEKQITELRYSMGNDYHSEAEYRSKLEEISEKLNECEVVKTNCKNKKREVVNEFTMTRNLLSQIDPNKILKLESSLEECENLNDQELKEYSRQLIDELSQKEANHFKKIKEIEKSDNVTIEEDIDIYRMIFSEFEKAKKEYESVKDSVDYLSKKLENLSYTLEEYKARRLSIFMEGFNIINKNIKEIFNLITFGGNAELDLIDYLNPFAEGIVLNIMPPKKSWKQVSTLSGGEKTLSSLSLIFSLHKYKPSSLYIMDEIDAALDFKNVSIISQYLMHVNSQFIIISLRNDMFEKATTLVGVYKTNNESHVITVDLNKLAQQ